MELILEAEEAFGISVAEEELAGIRTVGEFYEAILRQMPPMEKRFNLSAATFDKVRSALAVITGRALEAIHPSTDLSGLIPARRRRALWRELEQQLNLRLPTLSFPGWCVTVALSLGVLPAVAGAMLTDWFPGWFWILLAWVAIFLAIWLLDRLFGTVLREEIRTVGGFADAVLARNYAKLSAEFASQDREEVWQSLRILVVQQLGVRVDQVTKEARWVDDLGMD